MLQERSMRGREIEGRRAARKESMDQLMKKAKVLRQTSAGERGSRGCGMRECMRERERERKRLTLESELCKSPGIESAAS